MRQPEVGDVLVCMEGQGSLWEVQDVFEGSYRGTCRQIGHMLNKKEWQYLVGGDVFIGATFFGTFKVDREVQELFTAAEWAILEATP